MWLILGCTSDKVRGLPHAASSARTQTPYHFTQLQPNAQKSSIARTLLLFYGLAVASECRWKGYTPTLQAQIDGGSRET